MKNMLCISIIFILLTGCYDSNIDDHNASPDRNFNQPSIVKNHLGKHGYKNISINQDYDNRLVETPGSRVDDCFFAKRKNHPEDSINYQVIDGKIAVISVEAKGFSSYFGVKIGDSEKSIYLSHGNERLEKVNNPYGEKGKDYSIFYWDNSVGIGTRYDIEDRIITRVSIGNENLKLMEGCA